MKSNLNAYEACNISRLGFFDQVKKIRMLDLHPRGLLMVIFMEN